MHLNCFCKKSIREPVPHGYEVDFVTQDHLGNHEIIQVVWDADDPLTLEREERALRQAEKELGVPGKLVDWTSYLREFIPS